MRFLSLLLLVALLIQLSCMRSQMPTPDIVATIKTPSETNGTAFPIMYNTPDNKNFPSYVLLLAPSRFFVNNPANQIEIRMANEDVWHTWSYDPKKVMHNSKMGVSLFGVDKGNRLRFDTLTHVWVGFNGEKFEVTKHTFVNMEDIAEKLEMKESSESRVVQALRKMIEEYKNKDF